MKRIRSLDTEQAHNVREFIQLAMELPEVVTSGDAAKLKKGHDEINKAFGGRKDAKSDIEMPASVAKRLADCLKLAAKHVDSEELYENYEIEEIVKKLVAKPA